MKLYRVKINDGQTIEDHFVFGKENTKKYIRMIAGQEAKHLTRIRDIELYNTYIEAVTPMSLVAGATGTLDEISIEAQVERCIRCNKEITMDNMGVIEETIECIHMTRCQNCLTKE